jgi:hypothetical protein
VLKSEYRQEEITMERARGATQTQTLRPARGGVAAGAIKKRLM